jgi:hypothetical protein
MSKPLRMTMYGRNAYEGGKKMKEAVGLPIYKTLQ